LWNLDACVKTRVLVDRVFVMTTLKKCERLFSEVTCRSVARASRELDVPKISSCFKPYKMELMQALTPADKVQRHDCCEEMQLKMEENDFLERIIFCDEATFHIRGKVNGHNMSVRCAVRKCTVHFFP